MPFDVFNRYYKEKVITKERAISDIQSIESALSKIPNDYYKNNTETNLQIGIINPPKYGCDTLLRAKIVNALKRAEINVKRYNPEYFLSENIKDELLKELFNELK